MRVLSAVLADAGRIALDIAGIVRSVIERRREQQHEAVVALDEVLVNGRHRGRGAAGLGGAGDHAPRLRDRVDAAFDAAGRAERRAVVEVAAPIPVAVPSVPLERRRERGRVTPPGRSARASSRRISANGANAWSVVWRNHPSQTLSPLPASPTRFMPSFQSPDPNSGMPWTPTARLWSSARAQCSKRVALCSETVG